MTISTSNSDKKFFMVHHGRRAFKLYCYIQNEQDGIVLNGNYKINLKNIRYSKMLTI